MSTEKQQNNDEKIQIMFRFLVPAENVRNKVDVSTSSVLPESSNFVGKIKVISAMIYETHSSIFDHVSQNIPFMFRSPDLRREDPNVKKNYHI